ncbi:nuclear transport factor 2 family protein [Microbacterium indicum]|uniref:nuclear transport factor 2 family protein n=1 Tax=Microbacterium indicum TaxID=358100 RepID=UPI000405543B|nr:nuclear transport factor 2 family protein [Microbacterium indicum]
MSDQPEQPPAPQQPVPAQPVAPPEPVAAAPARPSFLAAITPGQWLSSLWLGGLALAGSLAVSLVTVLLAVIGISTSGDLPDDVAGMIGGMWFAAVFQFVGMGFLSPASARIQPGENLEGVLGFFSPELAQVSGSVSVLVPLLLIPAGTIAVVLIFGRRVVGADVAASRGQRFALAAAAGLGFALVMLLLQTLVPISATVPGIAPVALRAISLWGVILMAVVGAGSAYVVLGERPRVAGPWRDAAVHAVQHLGAYAALLGVASYVVAIVRAADGDGPVGAMLLLAPVLLPFVAVDALTVGMFGLLIGSGSLTSFVGNSQTVGMFSDFLPLWLRIVLPIVTVLVIVVAGLRWRVRAGAARTGAVSWLVLPVAYGAAGLIVLAFGTVSAGATVASFAGFSGAFGPAPWAFLLFALVGLAVDAIARFAAAPIAGILPAGVVSVLTWGVPRPGSVPAAAPAAAPAPVLPAGYAAAALGDTAAPTVPLEPVAPTAPAADPLVPSKPMSRRAKLAWAWSAGGVAVVALLVIGGFVAHGQLAQTTFGPQAKAEAYLEALVDGDAETATELWDPNVTSGERVLLTDAVYGAAEDRPTAYEITDVQSYEGSATVSATLTVDSKSYPVTLEMATSGRQAVLWDDWRIAQGPLQYISLGDVSGVTTVNGATVDLTGVSPTAEEVAQSGPVTIPVLPGSYTFQAPESTGVFTYGDDQTITVLPGTTDGGFFDGIGGDTEIAHFEATWTDEAQEDAIAQVKDRIAGCMTSDRFEPTDCPNTLDMYESGYGAVTGITRSWAEEPTYSFSTEDDASWFSSDSGPAVVIEGGEMTIDYQWRYDDEDDWEDESDTEYSVYGYGTRVPVEANDDGTVTVDFSEF